MSHGFGEVGQDAQGHWSVGVRAQSRQEKLAHAKLSVVPDGAGLPECVRGGRDKAGGPLCPD